MARRTVRQPEFDEIDTRQATMLDWNPATVSIVVFAVFIAMAVIVYTLAA